MPSGPQPPRHLLLAAGQHRRPSALARRRLRPPDWGAARTGRSAPARPLGTCRGRGGHWTGLHQVGDGCRRRFLSGIPFVRSTRAHGGKRIGTVAGGRTSLRRLGCQLHGRRPNPVKRSAQVCPPAAGVGSLGKVRRLPSCGSCGLAVQGSGAGRTGRHKRACRGCRATQGQGSGPCKARAAACAGGHGIHEAIHVRLHLRPAGRRGNATTLSKLVHVAQLASVRYYC